MPLEAQISVTSRRFRVHAVAASIVLLMAIWLSTGTMAPYGATLRHPAVLEPCHYLVNVDHEQFAAPFRMMHGDDFDTWGFSVVLRRLLFPILALPLVNVMGFLVGGVITSMAIHVFALIGFSTWVLRRIGESAAVTMLWLLATYPGVTYWAGLPYSYVIIVPGSLACMMLLYRLDAAPNWGEIAIPSLFLGVIFLGYDLLPFFGPATLLVLLRRRRWLWMFGAGIAMVLPSLLVAALFILLGVPLVNSNTITYLLVLSAYFHPADMAQWGRDVVALPGVFISNFLFGNFVVLPVLFCGALIVAWRRRLLIVEKSDTALLIASAALFLFNNVAPPYYGWQLRGAWMARLYQPVFPVFLLVIARVSQRAAAERTWRAAVALSILANGSIAFGPVLLNPIAAHVYQRFYSHSPPEAMLVNLRRFGRRPLGVCRTAHDWDHIPDPGTPFNRPAFMYRYPPP